MQIRDIRLRGVWITAPGPDVVDIKVIRILNRSFQSIVAGTIRTGTGRVAPRHARALCHGRDTLGVVGADVRRVLRRGDELLVRVVVCEVRVGLVLADGVDPAVVDAQGDEADLLACDLGAGDGCVLALEVGCEFWSVVAAVGLGEESEVPVLVLGEGGVEGLHELPDEGGGGHG